MANKVLWQTETGATIMEAELNSLADDGVALDGADYDNATNQYTEASFLLYISGFAGVPDGGGVELHAIYKVDGTHYGDREDGDVAGTAASLIGANSLLGIFNVRAADEDQYLQLMGVPLKPFACRFALKNTTGQAFDASGNTLSIYPYNYEVQ
jgi:hypothetical protein